jgi:hypothetical protein
MEESKEQVQEAQKQDAKKSGFIAAALVAIGLSYFVSRKLSGG